jgi:hypothetical protein
MFEVVMKTWVRGEMDPHGSFARRLVYRLVQNRSSLRANQINLVISDCPQRGPLLSEPPSSTLSYPVDGRST